jgi:hypothetical protein
MGIGKPVLGNHSRPNMRSDGCFYIKLWEMAGAAGFEPATYGFSNRIVTFEGVIAIRTSVIGPLPPPPSAAPMQTSTKIFSRKRLGPMNLTDNTDDEMISILESLPSYVKLIKLGRAKLVNGTLELLDILNSLKSFSKSADSYCHDIMRYYNPHSEVQETLIANLRVAGLLDAAGSSMSLHDANNKADLNKMIKRPMGMLHQIKNPEQALQFQGEISEWMEATPIDLAEDI